MVICHLIQASELEKFDIPNATIVMSVLEARKCRWLWKSNN
jgi:hypothetical protein